jgi:hypothetical protein
VGETNQAHSTGFPAEQVKALMDLLAGKGSQGTQTPQVPARTPDSPLRSHSNGKTPALGSQQKGMHGPFPLTPGPYLPCPLACVPQTQGYRGTERLY